MDADASHKPGFAWYPGHVALTRRKIRDHIRQSDLVVEVLDSRIPRSSRAAALEDVLACKPRLVVLNKADLSHVQTTKDWGRALRDGQVLGVKIQGAGREDPAERLLNWLASVRGKLRRKRAGHRVVVVGLPNVGKSRFINRLVGHRRAKVADKPGVTRGPQWVGLPNGFELLDLPGVVYPGAVEGDSAWNLALCHVVPREAVDGVLCLQYLAERIRAGLIGLKEDHPFAIAAKAGDEDPLGTVAVAMNMIARGGVPDRERAEARIFHDFSAARLGRISLEHPNDTQDSPEEGIDDGAD